MPLPAYLLSIAFFPERQQAGSLGISSGVAWPFPAPVLGGGQASASLSQLHPPLLSSLCTLVPLLLFIFHRGCNISVIPLWLLQVLWLGFLIFTCFPSGNSRLVLGCNFLEQAPKPQPLDQAPCLPQHGMLVTVMRLVIPLPCSEPSNGFWSTHHRLQGLLSQHR